MAHLVETMMSAGSATPWHGLGEVIEGTASSAEALELAGLDWRVRKQQLQIADSEWRAEDGLVDAWALVRDSDGRVLAPAVGEAYAPLQNEEVFAIGDALVEGGARWETAGSLRRGERVWALMRMDEDDEGDEIVPGDTVRSFLLIGNAHDGRRSAEVCVTTVRVVCANTYRMALDRDAARAMRVRHVGDVATRLAQAAEILVHAEAQRELFVECSRILAATTVGRQGQIDYLVRALGIADDPEERTAQMRRKLDVAVDMLAWERNHTAPGSLWDAFNVVTDYTNHDESAARDGGDAAKRLENVQFGNLSRTNEDAFALAMGIALDA